MDRAGWGKGAGQTGGEREGQRAGRTWPSLVSSRSDATSHAWTALRAGVQGDDVDRFHVAMALHMRHQFQHCSLLNALQDFQNEQVQYF